MKHYIVNVSVKGGLWRGQKRKFAVGPIEAESKPEAFQKALDMVENDKSFGEYDSILATGARLARNENC